MTGKPKPHPDPHPTSFTSYGGVSQTREAICGKDGGGLEGYGGRHWLVRIISNHLVFRFDLRLRVYVQGLAD